MVDAAAPSLAAAPALAALIDVALLIVPATLPAFAAAGVAATAVAAVAAALVVAVATSTVSVAEAEGPSPQEQPMPNTMPGVGPSGPIASLAHSWSDAVFTFVSVTGSESAAPRSPCVLLTGSDSDGWGTLWMRSFDVVKILSSAVPCLN